MTVSFKVLIVEDDPMARQLFEMFINQSDRYELVSSIDNADMADLYCDSGRKKIDLILMDIRTAMYANGLDAAERIKKKNPGIKIIIVTSMPEYSYLQRAKDIGVDSFWYKEVVSESFYDLIDRTMNGEHIFPAQTPEVSLGLAKSTELTGREVEVLKELISGASNAEIADTLHMSVRTVKAHIQHMQEKTGFTNRTELAVRARETGFVINDENMKYDDIY